MWVKGNTVLVLLIMLLFACAALLQLSEDAYFAHLTAKQVEDFSRARKILHEEFGRLLISTIPEKCYSDVILCQTTVSGIMVNYALRQYQQDGQEIGYIQYTLCVNMGLTSIKLQVVVEQASQRVVSWIYA